MPDRDRTLDITSTPEWQALIGLPVPGPLVELFGGDPGRAERYVIEVGDLRIDYSKNAIDDAVLGALVDVAEVAGVERRRAAMLTGEPINVTEHRAVLHTALRAPAGSVIELDGVNVVD
jgi:glucose-6-phosphate isomerase